jgi:hypothetical protein
VRKRAERKRLESRGGGLHVAHQGRCTRRQGERKRSGVR